MILDGHAERHRADRIAGQPGNARHSRWRQARPLPNPESDERRVGCFLTKAPCLDPPPQTGQDFHRRELLSDVGGSQREGPFAMARWRRNAELLVLPLARRSGLHWAFDVCQWRCGRQETAA